MRYALVNHPNVIALAFVKLAVLRILESGQRG